MNAENKKILLVEDDTIQGYITKDFLTAQGFQITHCRDGKSGHLAYLKNRYNLIIIDVVLPVIDGFTLAEIIRKKNSLTPIIFLTSKAMLEDRIRGYRIGADDYITKPYSPEELLLRINAVLKRTENENNVSFFKFGKYEFDYDEQTLSNGIQKIQLTQKEADVLKMLCRFKNKLLKREQILKEIWGENDYFMGRSMDVYIARLRKLLKEDPGISIINVHNSGFKLMVEQEV